MLKRRLCGGPFLGGVETVLLVEILDVCEQLRKSFLE